MHTPSKPKALVAKCPLGWFAFSEPGELLAYSLFEKDPGSAADQFEKPAPASFTSELERFAVEHDARASNMLRKKMRSLAKELKVFHSDSDLNSFLSSFAAAQSRKVAAVSASRDKIVIQAANALDDMGRATNGLQMRLAEWFGLHYPEIRMPGEKLAAALAEYGARQHWPEFKGSIGAEMTHSDEAAIKEFAHSIVSLSREKELLEKYVRHAIFEIAPNVSALIDPLLAARLVGMAGSLERLAKMSSSTIQLLGAEKALFRALRKQGKSPKYGIIFLSASVQNAPEESRGKVARILASKLMMAARIDFYSKRDESEKLRRELEEEIKKTR